MADLTDSPRPRPARAPLPEPLPEDLKIDSADLEGLPSRERAATLTGAAHRWAERARIAERNLRRERASRVVTGAAAACVGGVLGYLAQWVSSLF